MITITYQGGTTISLQEGKRTLIVHSENGRVPKEGEIVFFGSPEENPTKQTISWPGEYDIDGISIRGIGHEEGAAVSYAIKLDGVQFAFLHSPLKEWSDNDLELLGDIDVLCVPSDNPKVLQKLVDEIDPRVLIPLDTGGADKHAEALKACGAQGKEPVASFEVKASNMPIEGREVVVLIAQK